MVQRTASLSPLPALHTRTAPQPVRPIFAASIGPELTVDLGAEPPRLVLIDTDGAPAFEWIADVDHLTQAVVACQWRHALKVRGESEDAEHVYIGAWCFSRHVDLDGATWRYIASREWMPAEVEIEVFELRPTAKLADWIAELTGIYIHEAPSPVFDASDLTDESIPF